MAEPNPTDNVVTLPGAPSSAECSTRPKRAKPKDPTATERQRRSRANKRKPVTVPVTPPTVTQPDVTVPVTRDAAPVTQRHAGDVLAYVAAVALAAAAAWFSIRGMVVLFPGSPVSVVCMTSAMEIAKLLTAGWLARRWRTTARLWRLVLVLLVAGLALINAAGVYAQLVAAHVGERGAAASLPGSRTGDVDARLELAAGKVADLDKQIAQIDNAIAEATKRGKTNAAMSVMEGQRKARAGLAGERDKAAGTLAALKTERAQVASQGHQAATEAAPIVYVAQMLGAGDDSERAIRWLIALMVLCCDPLAIALTAAASARSR
jgi:hypothetical protein